MQMGRRTSYVFDSISIRFRVNVWKKNCFFISANWKARKILVLFLTWERGQVLKGIFFCSKKKKISKHSKGFNSLICPWLWKSGWSPPLDVALLLRFGFAPVIFWMGFWSGSCRKCWPTWTDGLLPTGWDGAVQTGDGCLDAVVWCGLSRMICCFVSPSQCT